jgi:hypothetical protein
MGVLPDSREGGDADWPRVAASVRRNAQHGLRGDDVRYELRETKEHVPIRVDRDMFLLTLKWQVFLSANRCRLRRIAG